MRSFRVLFALALCGCASGVGSDMPDGIRVSDAAGVSGCQYVSDVYGSSPFYGVFAGPAMSEARKAALLEAKKMDATHVVFSGTSPNRDGTVAYGQAYKCNQ